MWDMLLEGGYQSKLQSFMLFWPCEYSVMIEHDIIMTSYMYLLTRKQYQYKLGQILSKLVVINLEEFSYFLLWQWTATLFPYPYQCGLHVNPLASYVE